VKTVVLRKDMVQRLEADRKTNLGLAYCENRKKIKEGEWDLCWLRDREGRRMMGNHATKGYGAKTKEEPPWKGNSFVVL
jgi:hypothetical protein